MPTQMCFLCAASTIMLDRADDGGIELLVERRHGSVAAVDGHQVLDQVVRADAQEVHLCGDLLGHHRGARDLDHDADLDLRVEGNPFALQFLLCLARRTPGRDGPPAMVETMGNMMRTLLRTLARRMRPELGEEEVRTVEQHADAAPAEERVLFVVRVGRELVAADVERPEDDRMRDRRLPATLRVDLVLLSSVG